MDNERIIPLDAEIERFKHCFENNRRSILSAPFGEGKSFFLNEFRQAISGEYDIITLYPTNYQACENKDIFEYIKRDILLGILALDDSILHSFTKPNLQIIKEVIFKSSDDIIDCIPDIRIGIFGNGIQFSPKDIAKTIKSIFNQYKSFRRSNRNILNKYLDEFENEKGTIYEFDPISRLICDLVNRLKDNKRKIALVIEDIDRIDPGHIFRILNIFSAHFSQWDGYDDGKTNKFDFDKILVVCDYDNIENIYHHLYGEKTDFNGYISKFSSGKVFRYSLRSKMHEYLKDCIYEYLKSDVIANLLASEIMQLSEQKGRAYMYNLRKIVERIRYCEKIVITDNLYFTVKDSNQHLQIPKTSTMLLFIAICKQFDIDYGAWILKPDINETKRFPDELYKMLNLFMLMNLSSEVYYDGEHYYIPTRPYMEMHFDYTAIELIVENNEIIEIRNRNGGSGIQISDYSKVIELIQSYDKYVND